MGEFKVPPPSKARKKTAASTATSDGELGPSSVAVADKEAPATEKVAPVTDEPPPPPEKAALPTENEALVAEKASPLLAAENVAPATENVAPTTENGVAFVTENEASTTVETEGKGAFAMGRREEEKKVPLKDSFPLFAVPKEGSSSSSSSSSAGGGGGGGVPYKIPPWSGPPGQPYSLEVIKDGTIIDTLQVSHKGAFMFGRIDRCDFMLEHPSISRYHTVLQYKRNGDAFIYDLGSTHGTFMNKKQVEEKVFVPLHVGDVLRFGLSTRLYVFQGPTNLMLSEGPTLAQRQLLREVEMARQCDASILHAKREAVAIEGVTWGMMEDAVEEEIEEEEITWKNYKGELTDKQKGTLEKIQKRTGKLSSLRKEIDAIRAKEIGQGGLTQGQQTQIARNEQRIEQLMEEVDNLEETLNESIEDSLRGYSRRKQSGRGRTGDDDEDEISDDDDEFYDRTNKQSSKKAALLGPVVETAETLLEKRQIIMEEITGLEKRLEDEEKNTEGKEKTEVAPEDPLDAFMSSVSSKLGKDRAFSLRKELEKQQVEMERIVRLLKLADPAGEALRKWEAEKRSTPKPKDVLIPLVSSHKLATTSEKKSLEMQPNIEEKEVKDKSVQIAPDSKLGDTEVELEVELSMTVLQGASDEVKQDVGVMKKGPIWLGAARQMVVDEESAVVEIKPEETSGDELLNYKDLTKKSKECEEMVQIDEGGLEIRKHDKPLHDETVNNEERIWANAQAAAADVVARLLKRGINCEEEEEEEKEKEDKEEVEEENKGNNNNKRRSRKKTAKKKKVLGPERPDFLQEESHQQFWIPPQGQTGDGRTSLNEKYGY